MISFGTTGSDREHLDADIVSRHGRTSSEVPTRVCVVVCVNGLGHFRRVMEVVHLLHRERGRTRLEFDIYAEAWQLARLRDWASLAYLADAPVVRFHHGAMDGSPRWDSLTWTGDDYFSWISRIAGEEPILGADLVVSDNLVGVLSVRPDAILMGSFLWHDVIRGVSEGAESVASFEEELLLRNRPPMLCVADIVMPAVEQLTRAVRLPWFCEAVRNGAARSWPLRGILLMGGATDVSTSALRELARLLHEHTDLAVAVPPRLLGDGVPPSGRLQPFGFSDAEFGACSLAVGRPGAGLLTDCVRYGMPILCFGDEENAEMQHNARRVEALGIGKRIPLNDPGMVVDILRKSLRHAQYANWIRNVSRRPRGGSARAAHFIARKLNVSPDGA